MSAAIWQQMCAALDDPRETAAVLLAGFVDDPSRPALLVNEVCWVPESQYVEREPHRLSIASPGWVPALKRAADRGLHAIFFHTHPSGAPRPSHHDAVVDAAIAAVVGHRTGTGRYASLIVGGTSSAPEFTGRLVDAAGDETLITRVRILGRRIHILAACDQVDMFDAGRSVHDRQVRAFGAAGNQVLAGVRVGVVGAGGTGSAVLEQLVRLGVRDIITVDDDSVTPTNVSRIYGSGMEDEGRLKVDVAADNAVRIGLGTNMTAVQGRTSQRAALQSLRTCDVVFGCTDDHAGRHYLSRLSFDFLIAVIDMGIAIDAPDERIRSITGRISYVGPGEGCLICKGVVDPDRVRDEGYSPEERSALAGEGYARGLGEPDPSVIAYTTMVASWAVADLLERLFGFGSSDVRGELRIRIADRKITTRSAPPNPQHYCGQPSVWGRGDRQDFLGQRVWAA